MLNVLIVTDSAASFPDRTALQSPHLHIVPCHVHIDGHDLLEGVDISTRDVWEKLRTSNTPPVIKPPTPLDFYKVFQQASSIYDGILSIHSSAALSDSYAHANAAADRISGRCHFAQIDSQALCVGQGLLVEEALRQIHVAATFDEFVREIRSLTQRLFGIHYVESTETLLHNGIVSAEHSVLSSMLGVKPLLTIDNGKIVTTGKARTRAQLVDQLVEFAQGFEAFDAAVIVQPDVPQRSETTRLLLNRLTDTFPGRSFLLSGYAPAMASIVGPHAGGLVILGSQLSEEHGSYED
jgi:DegV family protein with EDD domain